jgi:hypothetical protein
MEERNLRHPPMLMDQQNQHYENGHTTKNSLHVQCNPYQNSNDVLYRNRKINLKTHMETQKISNSQSNSEQKVQC